MGALKGTRDNLSELKNFLAKQLPQEAAQVAANDLSALVTNRVVQKGIDHTGKPFSPYSTRTVAAFRFYGKSRTQAAERRIRALAKAKGVLSSEEFRKINNLRTDKKNFEFTGEMWRKFGIVRQSFTQHRVSISMGGTTTESQRKIDANSEKEGVNIVEANKKELDLVRSSLNDWITEQSDRILNL